MSTLWPDHLFLVGCGNMAGQMLVRWLACGLDPARVTVLRPSGRAVAEGVRVISEYPATLPPGTTILLGMKPYQLADVAELLAPISDGEARLVSILAGTRLADLRQHFPAVRDIVRAMPNLPVGIGGGVTALCADERTAVEGYAAVEALMSPLGLVERIADEGQFNEVTALSGCGPAFLFRFIDAFARAGEAIGLSAEQAARMAMATVWGSANMAKQAADSPGVLADRVASPGGMTREGLNVLDADGRLLKLMTDTLTAARDRGEEMARGG